MIVKQTCYMIKCDSCDEYLDDMINGIPVGFSEEETLSYAYDNGWTEKDGKHYCESCKERLEIDDE